MNDFLSDIGGALNRELFQIGETPISVATLVTLGLILLFSLWISKWLRRLIHRVLGKRNPSGANTLGALVHYAVLVIGFSTALTTAGINLTALFAAGAIFAVGLGFAMQNIVQNFVAGIIILTERTIKPGDVVEVDGLVVKISDMGIRASIALSRDGAEMIIPNSVLSQSWVKNYTLRNSFFRVRVPVGVTYSSDMKLVQTTLQRVADDVSSRWGVTSQPPQVVMVGFGDNSVNWEVGVWMSDPWESRPAASDLYQCLWWALKEAGITIAFPQLDIHFDGPVEESLRRLSGRAA